MRASTIIMVIASIGFILMGLAILKSNGIRKLLEKSYVYEDAEGFIKLNGKSNIGIGILGLLLAGVDYIFVNQSKYIVIIFVIIILGLSYIQRKIGEKYKGY